MGTLNRPGWVEVVAILAGCVVTLAVLARMDDRGRREHVAKAKAALRENAAHVGRVTERPRKADVRSSSPARTEGTGLPRPVVAANSGVGLSIAANVKEAEPKAAAAKPAAPLRRIEPVRTPAVGRRAQHGGSEAPPPRFTPRLPKGRPMAAVPAAAPAPPPAPRAPLAPVIVLLAGLGAALALAGAVVLSRR